MCCQEPQAAQFVMERDETGSTCKNDFDQNELPGCLVVQWFALLAHRKKVLSLEMTVESVGLLPKVQRHIGYG